jgi:hypothetical protein
MSFVLFQGAFAILGGVIMGFFMINNEMAFPNDAMADSLSFILLMVLVQVSMIPFSMALSTFFQDSKVANYVGNLFNTLPILIFI